MGIGWMVPLGIMMGVAIHSGNEQDDKPSSGTNNHNRSRCFTDWKMLEYKHEQEHKKIIQREFSGARRMALNSKELMDEAERTGFFFVERNSCIDDGVYRRYMSHAYGFYEDYRIYVISKKPINDYEINIITNAFWYLMITEENEHFSKADFEKAVEVGGYTTYPMTLQIADVYYQKKFSTLNVFLD